MFCSWKVVTQFISGLTRRASAQTLVSVKRLLAEATAASFLLIDVYFKKSGFNTLCRVVFFHRPGWLRHTGLNTTRKIKDKHFIRYLMCKQRGASAEWFWFSVDSQWLSACVGLTVMLQWMISSFSPVTLNWQLSSSGFQSIILNRSWLGSKIDSRNFNSAFSPETDIFYSSQTTRPLAEGKSGRDVTAQLSRVYGSRMLAWEQQQRAGGWGSWCALSGGINHKSFV